MDNIGMKNYQVVGFLSWTEFDLVHTVLILFSFGNTIV